MPDFHHLTFDNLFTSLHLVDCLAKKGTHRLAETMRTNRNQDCPLMPVNALAQVEVVSLVKIQTLHAGTDFFREA